MKSPVKRDLGGYRKFGFKLKNGRIHLGDDFNTPFGSDVFSILQGVVIYAAEVQGFGGCNPSKPGGVVVIRHVDENYRQITALYGHVKISDKIEVGSILQEGEKIGTIGHYYSGKEDWPHLHFGIHKGKELPPFPWGYDEEIGGWINTIKYLKKNGVRI